MNRPNSILNRHLLSTAIVLSLFQRFILATPSTYSISENFTSSIEAASEPSVPEVFWLEDFSLPNGTTEDNGPTAWNLVDPGNGTFSVQDNEFMASFNSAHEGVWLSEKIDISTKSNVVVTVDLRSATASTSDYLESDDYIRVFYKLDDGEETLFYEDFAGLGNTTNSTASLTVNSGYLNAGTLQIIIKARNSHATERYYFDNVEVAGTDKCAGSIIEASVSVSGLLTCSEHEVTLYGNSNISNAVFNWSGPDGFSSLLQNPDVSSAGLYILTVKDALSGCSATAPIEVEEDGVYPSALAGVSGQLSCSQSSVTLTGNSSTPGVYYYWTGPENFYSDEQNPVVHTLGTYILTVKNLANGCSSTSSVEVTSAPLETEVLWSEDFSLPNGTTEDNGPTGWDLANPGNGTFSVQDNEFLASFNSANEGVWLSEKIDISTKSNVVVTVDLRSATASTSDYLEPDDYIRVFYKLDDGEETLFYEDFAGLGNTTNSTSSLTVNSGYLNAGILQIIIKARNSHATERYYFDNVEVAGTDQVIGPITTEVSGSITCLNQQIQLFASVENPVATYFWITPDNETINQQNPVVQQSGKYTVNVVLGGCMASKTVQVTGNNLVPDISISGDHLICSDSASAQLKTISPDTDLTYSWTGPSGFFSDLRSPTVSDPGIYTVTVTDQFNYCTNATSFKVYYGKMLWLEDFDTLEDGTVQDQGATAWGTDNSKIHTVDLSYYSSESGVPYYFEVRENKLTAKSTRGEVVWKSGPIDISNTDSVFVSVDITGEGTLNDRNDCGLDCFDYDYIEVLYKLNGGVEIPFDNFGSIPGKLALQGLKVSDIIAGTGTLQLIIKAYNTGNAEIFNFDNIKVLALGSVSEKIVPVVSGPLTCFDTLVTLAVSSDISGNTYSWTGPGGFISTDPVIGVSKSGIYTLMVNGVTGCVSSDTSTIEVVDSISVPGISLSTDGRLTCENEQVTISGGLNSQEAVYYWTGAGGFHSDSATISVDVPGYYYLFVQVGMAACSATDSILIETDTLVPANVFASSNGKLTCLANQVLLNGFSSTPGVTYTWNGPDDYAAFTQRPAVDKPGTYHLIVKDTVNGCESVSMTEVDLDTIVPVIIASVLNDLNCGATSTSMSATSNIAGATYQWSGPSGFSSSQQRPVTTQPGRYVVTATDPANGCSSTYELEVKENYSNPEGVSATVSGVLNCKTDVVLLSGRSSTGSVKYSWVGPEGFISESQNPEVSVPGNYILTVKDTVNQCSTVKSVMVEQKQNLPEGVRVSVSGILSCNESNVTLIGSSLSDNVSFTWTTPNGSSLSGREINATVPGEYVLEVIGEAEECRVYDTVTVLQDVSPPAGINTAVSGSIDCNNTPVTLFVQSSTPGVYYNWIGPGNFVSNEQNPITAFEGEYTVRVISPLNGCFTEGKITVTKEMCQ
jgi:hypothetical protein